MMSIRRFKTLIAIAELGTFSAAAKAEYLTPSAVSQQMKALEHELDVTLFDRSKRPPELNPAGYALVPKAKELVKIYETIKPTLAGKLESIEHLTVGTVPTTMTGIMPRALKMLQNSYDNLHVRLYPALSDDLYAQVDRGFLDAAVLTEPPTAYEHLIWRPFTEEPFVVLASNEIHLDEPQHILESQPFLRFSRKAWVGRIIDQWLLDQNIQVHETMELETLEAISAMVMNNLGVSIVPLNCCSIPVDEYLRAIPLGDSAPKRVLGVLCRRDTSKHKLVDLLWKQLVTIVEQTSQTQSQLTP